MKARKKSYMARGDISSIGTHFIVAAERLFQRFILQPLLMYEILRYTIEFLLFISLLLLFLELFCSRGV